MGYLPASECDARLQLVRDLLRQQDLDLVLVYYDEFNIGNGWYLTGWCPQFETGAVLVPREGTPMILGGPESEPFAKLDSAIKETRNFTVFMVPDEEYPNAVIMDFAALFDELNATLGQVRRVGLVGADQMPAAAYRQIQAGFEGVELVDVTDAFLAFRVHKSAWERDRIRNGFELADHCYDAMVEMIRPGVTEIEVAAAGEYAARRRGATGFGFTAIVGSGTRANAVVPTASSKPLQAGETVMIGLAPKVSGYSGVMGAVLPVSGSFSAPQAECMGHLKEAFALTRAQLVPGRSGREIDAPARALYEASGLLPYLVCPFVHTIGLHEAEAPFFGPNGDDVLEPGMTVCVDVSFFGHQEYHGVRIETGYEITAAGAVPFSPKMEALLMP